MQFDGTLIVVFLSFLVFMFLMRQVYFEPVRLVKEHREQEKTASVQAAAQLAQDAQKLSEDYAKDIQQARQKAQQHIQQARSEAQRQSAELVGKARAKAEAELADTVTALKQQFSVLYAELKADQAKLVDHILTQLQGKAPASVG